LKRPFKLSNCGAFNFAIKRPPSPTVSVLMHLWTI
jgi:hypothetical protein